MEQGQGVTRNSARVVVITGGTSGIGLCTARLFARRGWRVGLIARGEAGLRLAVSDLAALGATAAGESADVACVEALAAAAELLAAALGRADVWVNCAGNGVYGYFGSVPAAEFDRVTAVTYGGTVNGCRVALDAMRARGGGTIVNVCSAIAYHGMPMMTSYAGAKAAVRAFSQSLQAELRVQQCPVRISVVMPPAVNTPFFSHAISHMGWPARPARPVYQPEVVADAIYLAALRAPAEMAVSGTVSLFSLATRVSPRLIAWTMTKLGMEGQLSREACVAALQRPTLFAPLEDGYAVHGPFSAEARKRSVQMAVKRMLARVVG
jgi:NAD(P)-dependent dehydrogenase (short-subunit alcohol dehydrogenase family)